jgi:site-specific DNA-methyltransferase (adenine-specific)
MINLTLYQGDCLKIFPEIPDESIDLIVTSSPYNVGVDYGVYKDNLSFQQYYAWVKKWLAECYRVSRVGGRICINIPLAGNSPVCKDEHLETFVDKFLVLMAEAGYINRETIVWLKAHNGDVEKFCGNNTAWGSWLSPSNPYCRSFTEFILVSHKVEAKIQHSGVSDLTKAEFLKFSRNYWVMPTEAKVDHPAPYPEELPYRCIKFYSYIGDTVLDPFLGSGTTMKVARELKRNCTGFEIDPTSIKLCKQRLTWGSSFGDVNFKFKDCSPKLVTLPILDAKFIKTGSNKP